MSAVETVTREQAAVLLAEENRRRDAAISKVEKDRATPPAPAPTAPAPKAKLADLLRPRADKTKLETALADARAEHEQALAAEGEAALASVENPGPATDQALAKASAAVLKAAEVVRVREAAIEAAGRLEIAARAADAKREADKQDRAAKADLDRLAKAGAAMSSAIAAYVRAYEELNVAYGAVQPHLAANPRLRSGLVAQHPPREAVAVELTRASTAPATRPDQLPVGASVGALAVGRNQLEPLADTYRGVAEHAWK